MMDKLPFEFSIQDFVGFYCAIYIRLRLEAKKHEELLKQMPQGTSSFPAVWSCFLSFVLSGQGLENILDYSSAFCFPFCSGTRYRYG